MSTEPDESTDTGWSHQTERSFHRVFPQVPRSEKLVDSAQCGIVKGFVRMGRIYVTPIRCSFDSPFLSCSVSVLWEDVHRMERKKQILFDALALHLRNGKVISFTAFLPGCLTKILQLSMALCAIRQRHDLDQNDESSTSSEDWDNLDISEAPFSCSDSQSISARSSAGRSRSQSPAMEENGNFSQLSPPEELDERSITSTPKSALYDENAFSGNGKAKDSDSEVPSQPSRKRSLADLSVTRKLGDCAEVRISFPQLPLDETVIASFQCNYVKGVHRPGKLFVTERSVLFASTMIPENIQITFDEVKSVQKEQTMIILAGICVKLSAGNSLRFTSFLSRDAAFNTISSSFRKFCCKTSVTKALAATSITHFVTHTCSCDESAIPSASSRGDFSSVDTEHGSAFSDASCFTKELFRDPVRFPVGRTVLDIFGSCFDDETAVLHKYHALRKDVDQHWGKWLPTKDGGGFRGQRVFTCTTHVKALMGKACPFTEFQRYAFLNIRGSLTLLVQFSSQVSGVLFSDTFRAESLIVFSQSGSNSQSEVTMQAYGYVQFLKSTWMKGRINSNTLSELSESFSLLESLLMERVQIMATQQCNFEDTVDDEGTCEVSTTDSLSTCTPYFSHPFLNVATEWRAVNMILLVWSFFLLVLALYGVMSHGVVFKNYGEESPVVDLLSNFCTTVCSIGVYISVQFIASLAASMS